jgi:hypothetical protein
MADGCVNIVLYPLEAVRSRPERRRNAPFLRNQRHSEKFDPSQLGAAGSSRKAAERIDGQIDA